MEFKGKNLRTLPEQVEYLTNEWKKLGKEIAQVRAILKLEDKEMTKRTKYEIIKKAEELGLDPFFRSKLQSKKLMREMAKEENIDLPEYVWIEIDEKINSFESDKISEFDLALLLDEVCYDFGGEDYFYKEI